jgi:hypothetical protein
VIGWTVRDKIGCAPPGARGIACDRDGSPKGGDAGRCVGGSVYDSPAADGGSPNGLMGDWRKGIDSAAPVAYRPTV